MSFLYATQRDGPVWILNPSTMALAPDFLDNPSQLQPPFMVAFTLGPALFGISSDPSTGNIFLPGVPTGGGSYLALAATNYDSTSGQYIFESSAVAMPTDTFQPESMAIDFTSQRLFVGDSLRSLTAWGYTGIPIAGSPYYPSNGLIKAQGVAFDSVRDRVYTCCNSGGQDALAVYDASTSPMTQISGSPFPLFLSLSTSHTSILYDAANDHILITLSFGALGLVVLDASTFAPIPGSPFLTGGDDPRAMALDTVNDRIYICNYGTASLAALTASTLAPIPGSPFYVGGFGPKSVLYSPDTNYVYVANVNSGPGGISVFNASTMAHISGSPFFSNTSFSGLAIGPTPSP